jgi:hypothetical protein
MSEIPDIDTFLAEKTYAVANTPLFLLRKLREDPAVLQIARAAPIDAIFDALKSSLEEEPRNLRETVLPYFCLIALAIAGNRNKLEEATRLRSTHAEWYSYIANVLLETHQSTVSRTLEAPRTIKPVMTISASSTAPVASQTVKLSS